MLAHPWNQTGQAALLGAAEISPSSASCVLQARHHVHAQIGFLQKQYLVLNVGDIHMSDCFYLCGVTISVSGLL